MTPSATVEKHRDAVHALVRQFQLSNPRIVVASGGNGEAQSNALDFLVDTRPTTTLFDLGGLQIELEELLGVDVHVVATGGLREGTREQVLKKAVAV